MPLVFPLPPLSTKAAHIFSLFFTSSYVGSIYVSKNARISFRSTTSMGREGHRSQQTFEERRRDDSDVIKARLIAVCVSTLVICTSVFRLIWHLVGDGPGSFRVALETTSARLGLALFDDHTVYPYIVSPFLFLGPLYATFLYRKLPFQHRWSLQEDLYPAIFTWIGVRNYIVGPLTEELVYRACVLAVYHLAGSSTYKMIFLSPFFFGLAHVHHAWETYNKGGRTRGALRRAALASSFQLAYTTLFGFHCAFLFLRTGSLYPPLFSHIFCNFMGIPDLGNELRRFPNRKWSLITTYVLGIVGYVYTMKNWTLAEDSLYWSQVAQRY